MVYTILSSKFTNATLESVKNNYAGKNNIQIPIHGTIVPSSMAGSVTKG